MENKNRLSETLFGLGYIATLTLCRFGSCNYVREQRYERLKQIEPNYSTIENHQGLEPKINDNTETN